MPSTYPLPEGWSRPELLTDTVRADGVELRRAGISSRGPSGEELTGAAVEADGSPVERGCFELLERVSTVLAMGSAVSSYELLTADGEPAGRLPPSRVFPESDAPSRWRYARSNGVALHASWRQATERALWELAERDRILRSWYGETRAVRIDFDVDDTPLGASRSYEWLAYSFPEPPSATFGRSVDVVGLFGMPASPTLPLISGYGARPDRAAALDAAAREALQALGFLWDEPVIEAPPPVEPTPMYHLEYFQWSGHRDRLRQWLEVGHTERGGGPADRPKATAAPTPVAFIDLTPAWLGGGLRVAKAVCDSAAPLVFGDGPFCAHLPSDLRTHPIG